MQMLVCRYVLFAPRLSPATSASTFTGPTNCRASRRAFPQTIFRHYSFFFFTSNGVNIPPPLSVTLSDLIPSRAILGKDCHSSGPPDRFLKKRCFSTSFTPSSSFFTPSPEHFLCRQAEAGTFQSRQTFDAAAENPKRYSPSRYTLYEQPAI